MKSGCLIKALVASTIFFAIVFYIATNKMDDYFINPIKNFSVKYMMNDLKDEWSFIKASPEKDSLFLQMRDFGKSMANMRTVHLNAVNEVLDSVKFYLNDSAVSHSDLESIKTIIEAKLKNERSKKN